MFLALTGGAIAAAAPAQSGPVNGAQVHVAFSPRGEALGLILGELKNARTSVDVAMVYFSHEALADALCSLAQRGVKVRLLTDVVMTRPAHQPMTERLARCGVSVHVLPLPTGGRMHMKCAVIDGQTVISGAANWSPTAFDQNFEDTLIVRSPELARQYSKKIEALLDHAQPVHGHAYGQSAERVRFPELERHERSKQTDRFQAPRARTVGSIRSAEVYFTPGQEGLRKLLAQARAATERIDIGMYLVNYPEAVQTLAAIAREGKVNIRMILDAGMLGGNLLPRVQELWEAGVDIHYYQQDRDALHLKTAVIDGRYVWTGSANWTTAAMEFNVEDMLCFDSSEMARLYTDFLDGIQQVSQSFAPLARGHRVNQVAVQPTTSPTGFLTGLPPTGPRTNFNNILNDPIFPGFETRAAVSYLPDEEYYPVLLDLVRNAHQSILIAMFVMPETKTEAPFREQLHRELERAADRGVYVYLLLHMPTSVQDRLHESHSNWAEKLRAKGVDVRLNLPHIHLHAKMAVVDLAKVLIGSHNWSEGALSGERVYESSALLVLPEQDIRFADYILSRQTISDMRSKELWEQEISLLRHVAVMSSSERAAFLRDLPALREQAGREAQAAP